MILIAWKLQTGDKRSEKCSFLVEFAFQSQIWASTPRPHISKSSFDLARRKTILVILTYFDRVTTCPGVLSPLWRMGASVTLLLRSHWLWVRAARSLLLFVITHYLTMTQCRPGGPASFRQMAQISIHISSSRSHQTQKANMLFPTKHRSPGRNAAARAWPFRHAVYSHRVIIVATG